MSALDNYIERDYSGTAYFYNNEFHNNKPQSSYYLRAEFVDGVLVEMNENPYSHTIGWKYPVHVEV
jgi:hypothetical protein